MNNPLPEINSTKDTPSWV